MGLKRQKFSILKAPGIGIIYLQCSQNNDDAYTENCTYFTFHTGISSEKSCEPIVVIFQTENHKFLKMSLCDCLNMNSNSVPVIPIISSISYSTGIGSNQTRWFKPNIYFLLSVCTMCRCLLSYPILYFVF